jgi:hypothetical protein
VDVLWRKETVYRTDYCCVKENGESVTDGSKWLEENGDSA